MIIFIIISILYFFIISLFIKGWLKIKSFDGKTEKYEFISIVVAAKNEEHNIGFLLNDIQNQNYPAEKYEVIIIDDNSTDKTSGITANYCKENQNFRLINSQADGKKNAIKSGIEQSNGDLIFTTDADCRLNQNHLQVLNSFYAETKAKMIIAPVFFGVEKKFQALEFISLQASTAGAAGLNNPIMCNAANMFFKKQVYFEFENPQKKEIESGDDVFLMLNIKKKYPDSIKYLKNKNFYVSTKPAENFKSFINQRIRWTSKSPYYKDFFVNFVGITIFLTNLAIIISLAMSIFNKSFLLYFFIIFSTKLISDFFLLYLFSCYYKFKKLMIYYLPTQIIYPFYVLLIGLLSLFIKPKWK